MQHIVNIQIIFFEEARGAMLDLAAKGTALTSTLNFICVLLVQVRHIRLQFYLCINSSQK